MLLDRVCGKHSLVGSEDDLNISIKEIEILNIDYIIFIAIMDTWALGDESLSSGYLCLLVLVQTTNVLTNAHIN